MKKLFFILFLCITSQLFAQQSDTITLNLLQPTYPSEFIFINNGYWDKTYVDESFTFFKSQIFSFSHLIEGIGSSWGGNVWNGFTVCNSGDNADHSAEGWFINYEWGCMAGGGIKTDENGNVLIDNNGDVMVDDDLPYLVGYWNYMIEPEWWEMYGEWSPLDEPTHCFQILLDDDNDYEAVGVYVNNHPYAYYSNLHGYGPAGAMNQSGDFFKIIIHGLNADGTESGKSVDFMLAQFENGQLTQNNKWEWIDLSSLGDIGGFYCTMATTIENSGGPVSPMYFCMDKLQVRTKEVITFISVENITHVPDSAMTNESLLLTGTVFPENATNQTIIWSVYDAGTTGATITGNLFIATNEGTAVVRATIKNGIKEGEDYIKDFTIDVKELIGIHENELSNVYVYSYKNSIFIKNEDNIYLKSVEIRDLTGRLVYQSAMNESEKVITLKNATSIYFVKLMLHNNVARITKIYVNSKL